MYIAYTALDCWKMTYHYDHENIILSWMKNSMQYAKQHFSTSISVSFHSMSEIVVSDMFSHYLGCFGKK